MYAHVSNGVIDALKSSLPSSWNNVSNFSVLSANELKTHGWYPVIQNIPVHDPDTEEVRHAGFSIEADSVIELYSVEPKAAPDPQVIFSKLQFRSRFTLQELVAIEVMRLNDPDATIRATLTVLADNMAVADEINITDPRTIYGLGVLQSFGLLTSQRVTEILTP
jgi:hypothetical protein